MVKEVKVKIGDSLSEGSVVIMLEEGASSATAPAEAPALVAAAPQAKAPAVEPPMKLAPPPPPVSNTPPPADDTVNHASPSVRKFARELGVTVSQVKGTGPKGRITQDDVQAYVKAAMSGGGNTGAASVSYTHLTLPTILRV